MKKRESVKVDTTARVVTTTERTLEVPIVLEEVYENGQVYISHGGKQYFMSKGDILEIHVLLPE